MGGLKNSFSKIRGC